MINRVSIRGIREKEEAVVMLWYDKRKRNGEVNLSGFRILVNNEALDNMEKTTRAKTELLVSQLYRLVKVKKIKTLSDIHVFVNRFVVKYNPYILFNGSKTFDEVVEANEINTLEKQYRQRGFVRVQKNYFKKQFKQDMKKQIKEEQQRQ